MNRRNFLRMTGTGVLLPAFLAEALAQDVDGVITGRRDDEPTPFERARKEAARDGKPLLVFLKPQESATEAYGAAIGDMMLHGDARLFADLALVVGTVATLEELQEAYPKRFTPKNVGGAYMLLLETEGAPQGFSAVRAELGKRPVAGESGAIGAPADAKQWIRPLQDALRAAISGGEDTLERRARTASAAIGETARRQALQQLQAAEADLAAVSRGAALLRRLAEGDGPDAEKPRALLQAAARHALDQRSPKGGVWHDSGHGCGGEYIGEEGRLPVAIACGIGRVPVESRRFLRYYVSPFGGH